MDDVLEAAKKLEMRDLLTLHAQLHCEIVARFGGAGGRVDAEHDARIRALAAGSRVACVAGSMAGSEGVVVRHMGRGSVRTVVQFDGDPRLFGVPRAFLREIESDGRGS